MIDILLVVIVCLLVCIIFLGIRVHQYKKATLFLHQRMLDIVNGDSIEESLNILAVYYYTDPEEIRRVLSESQAGYKNSKIISK